MEVILTSPWLPAEWLTAHGHQPRGAWFHPGLSSHRLGLSAGACPFAHRVLSFAERQRQAAFIFTTHCDQLRRAWDALSAPASERVFLFNLPATWQTAAAHNLLSAELQRLGDFLVRLGGSPPTPRLLAEHQQKYRAARMELAQAGRWCFGSAYAKALAQFHWDGTVNLPPPHPGPDPEAKEQTAAPRLALIGGPFGSADWPLLNEIETLGARVVLNATETGERSLAPVTQCPCAGSPGAQNPARALAESLLAQCVDVFQRPNAPLYAWLAPRLAQRKVQGLLLWHYVGCDLWRAEAESLREAFQLPLLLLERDESGCLSPRDTGRLQAFLEALQ